MEPENYKFFPEIVNPDTNRRNKLTYIKDYPRNIEIIKPHVSQYYYIILF